MLPFNAQDMTEMKLRFYKALETPIDATLVQAGVQKAASSNENHVFDFRDGMRICVSADLIEGDPYLHVSASGTKEYADSIKDEGLEGFIEDVILRVSALCGSEPGEQVHAVMTQEGVLHMIFETDYEGLVERSKRVGSGDSVSQ